MKVEEAVRIVEELIEKQLKGGEVVVKIGKYKLIPYKKEEGGKTIQLAIVPEWWLKHHVVEYLKEVGAYKRVLKTFSSIEEFMKYVNSDDVLRENGSKIIDATIAKILILTEGDEEDDDKISIAELEKFIKDHWEELKCPSCEEPLAEFKIDKYEHDGGVKVKEAEDDKKYWVYITCGNCEYDIALWKFETLSIPQSLVEEYEKRVYE